MTIFFSITWHGLAKLERKKMSIYRKRRNRLLSIFAVIVLKGVDSVALCHSHGTSFQKLLKWWTLLWDPPGIHLLCSVYLFLFFLFWVAVNIDAYDSSFVFIYLCNDWRICVFIYVLIWIETKVQIEERSPFLNLIYYVLPFELLFAH